MEVAWPCTSSQGFADVPESKDAGPKELCLCPWPALPCWSRASTTLSLRLPVLKAELLGLIL